MIKDVCSQTIDFNKVERVGGVGGDPSWLRFTVYFTGGGTVEFYHERKYSGNHSLDQINRDDFIKIWKSNS